MRALALFALLLSAPLAASPWGLDLGVSGGVGLHRFAGEPGGLPPSTSSSNLFAQFPPSVQGSGGTGLSGAIGPELSLNYKRRYSLSVQALWQLKQLTMDESLRFSDGTELQRRTQWGWASAAYPIQAAYAHPLWVAPKQAIFGRIGAGAWYEHVQDRKKTLHSGASDLSLAWSGPPDDWGPLLSLGFDVLALPSGKRLGSVEFRATRGTALQDPQAGAGLPTWTLQLQVTVGVWMWVL